MPTWPEIARSLNGAWRLAHFDPRGMSYFELSIEGFWKSFGAAALAFPVYIYFVAVNFDGTDSNALWFVVVKALAYVVPWIVFPIVMAGLSKALNLTANYIPFIIASNWASVLQALLFIPVQTLAAFGSLTDVGLLLYLLTVVAVLIYQWFVTYTALRASMGIAAALVVIDLILGLSIASIFDRLV